MHFTNGLSRLICMVGLVLAPPPAELLAHAGAPTDAALGRLIEQLTDRRTDGLVPAKLPDGTISLDLRGRFQQVALGQFIGGNLPMMHCVNSVEEANVFFGRDLRTGAPLPPEASAEHEALLEEALRHGMSVSEYQFYFELIEQSLAARQLSAGSTITIVNGDGPDEGFNSTEAQFLPAPGNDTNSNLGEQRLALFNAAAAIWGAFLDSSVAIQVQAQFDPLSPCSPSGGVLGSAAAASIVRDFTNAEYPGTWYHVALANKRAGGDLSGGPDLNTTFNSSVDQGCLGAGTHFYYGLDNATPPGTINLFVVLLHELGHGLGFSSFTSGTTGAYLGGYPDIWARFLYDDTLGLTWFEMTQAQRAASAINPNNVYWNGVNVAVASGFLSNGRDPSNGQVQMYTPNPYRPGSSVSHYNTAAFPNLLMEPSINAGLPLTLDLTRQQMRDIGWYRDADNDLVPDNITNVSPSGGSLEPGMAQNITWSNTEAFSENVTIELSLDGGSTWPTVIASDVTNTGSYAWSVPNSPTSQAMVRVREHDFVAPLGQSANTFVIEAKANTAPTFTPAGAQSRQQGSPPGAAVTIGTVGDDETAAGDLVVTRITGGTATGITVGSISNSGGTVTATLAASCTATAGTVRFQVSDGNLTGNGDLQVNVSPNSEPTVGAYPDVEVVELQDTSINPASAPADNGSVDKIDLVAIPDTFSGTLEADPVTGEVSIVAADPVGIYTIAVTVTDNCSAAIDREFTLEVLREEIFADGFESR
jgi:hypothetical protein